MVSRGRALAYAHSCLRGMDGPMSHITKNTAVSKVKWFWGKDVLSQWHMQPVLLSKTFQTLPRPCTFSSANHAPSVTAQKPREVRCADRSRESAWYWLKATPAYPETNIMLRVHVQEVFTSWQIRLGRMPPVRLGGITSWTWLKPTTTSASPINC